jgi:hypothetical protein
MQSHNLSSSNQSNQPDTGVTISVISDESQTQPVGWIQKAEVWSGRLAMFGLTTIMATIAINPH